MGSQGDSRGLSGGVNGNQGESRGVNRSPWGLGALRGIKGRQLESREVNGSRGEDS